MFNAIIAANLHFKSLLFNENIYKGLFECLQTTLSSL